MATDMALLRDPFRYPPLRCTCQAGHPACQGCRDYARAQRLPVTPHTTPGVTTTRQALVLERQMARQALRTAERWLTKPLPRDLQTVWRRKRTLALRHLERLAEQEEAPHA